MSDFAQPGEMIQYLTDENEKLREHLRQAHHGSIFQNAWHTGGLTKRELFSAMAMQGLSTLPDLDAPQIADYAVQQADALIEALNKPTPAQPEK